MKKLLLVGIFFLMLSTNVKALNYESGSDMQFNIECYKEDENIKIYSDSTTFNPGQEATCEVNFATVDYSEGSEKETQYFKKATFTLVISSGLTMTDITTKSGYTVSNSGKTYTFETSATSEKIANLITFKMIMPTVTANTTYDISLDNLVIYNTKNQTIGSYGDKTTKVTVTFPKSTVNTLSDLKVNGTTVTSFSGDSLTYNLASTQDSSLTISATKTDSKSTIAASDIGTKELKFGSNTFNIRVTSESGVTKTYKIIIVRDDSRSNVNTLSTLTLSTGTISFEPTITNYDLTVGNTVDNIVINSTLTDSKSSYVTDYGNQTVSLKSGANIVYLKVKAENEEIRTYTLNINREDGRSSINTLNSLTLSNGHINFDSSKTTYEFKVGNSVQNLTIDSTLTDTKATYISNYGNRTVKLEVGINTIYLKIKAENGSEKVYTLAVTRKEEGQEVSTNANLKILRIGNYPLNFTNDTYIYDLQIDKETALDVQAICDDMNANVVVTGNNNLKDNSVITVKVLAEDNYTTKTYTIRINSQSTISGIVNINWPLTIVCSIGGLSVLSFFIYLILDKKTKKA